MSFSRIAYSADAGTGAIMNSLLHSEGVDVPEMALSGHVSIAGADQGVYVTVADREKERACKILQDHGFGQYLLT